MCIPKDPAVVAEPANCSAMFVEVVGYYFDTLTLHNKATTESIIYDVGGSMG